MNNLSKKAEKIIIIDDDIYFSSLVKRWFENEGFQTKIFSTGEEFLFEVNEILPVCVCLDLTLPGSNGLEILAKVKEHHKQLPVIILTGESATDKAVKAIQLGAYDYLVKPIDRHKLLTSVKNAVDRYQISLRLSQLEREKSGNNFLGLIGNSQPMKTLFWQIEKVAACDITVLINGESGTGKELVAKAIHQTSSRANFPFIPLNCAAIPESLQESELFGHEKGSFTGANNRRQGKFELANHGTLFLDEVAELSLSLQAKLLRVLQEKTFSRVGSSHEVSSDFRLVAASHKNLAEEVKKGNFREDLFFRLAVYDLEVPALRERKEDISLLVNYFLKQAEKQQHKKFQISTEALAVLENYHFSGNVRELENSIQRALVTANNGIIDVTDLPKRILQEKIDIKPIAEQILSQHDSIINIQSQPIQTVHFSNGEVPQMTLQSLEKLAIESSITRNSGNMSVIANELGIGRTTLYRKIKEYELTV
jgi:DNA-binding NtrC family response regulator